MLDLRAHFSRFLGADPGRLHFAAHSHHPWPDATRAAQLQAWDDAARWMDAKWEAAVLGPVWREAQGHVARHLRLPDPATVVFAPNTHEFAVRILSALPLGRPPRVLTTDGEFHSFARQAARLEEEGLVAVTRIPAEPGSDCLPRLVEAARGDRFDLVWASEVLFGTGFALDGAAAALAEAAGEAAVVIDGYHAFLARPVDLSAVAHRVFWLAGGYKYAMAGEGCCFLHCPPGWLPRPRATGWFAGFAALSQAGGAVGYAADGRRFLGATFDPSGLYRLNAAMRWLEGVGVNAAAVRAHAHALQARFAAGLAGAPLGLDPARLAVPLEETRRGNFLAFELEEAGAAQARLAAAGVVTDHRGRRLRIGFGLHNTAEEVDRLLDRLRALAGGGPPAQGTGGG
jgi:selenocysteine lyase/cysteine desulfurase